MVGGEILTAMRAHYTRAHIASDECFNRVRAVAGPGCERTPIDPRIPQSLPLLPGQKCVAATGPSHGQAGCVEFRSDGSKAHASALNEFCFLRWGAASDRLTVSAAHLDAPGSYRRRPPHGLLQHVPGSWVGPAGRLWAWPAAVREGPKERREGGDGR
jgi:hypothetical protein